MNKELLLFHLNDFAEDLDQVRRSIAADECDESELFAFLLHAYHHLNSAWNARESRSSDEADERFDAFRRFPAEFQEALGAQAAGGREELPAT